MILGDLQGHRTKEAGWDEGLVFGFFVLGDVRPSAALFVWELRIADQAVWPARLPSKLARYRSNRYWSNGCWSV